MHFAEFGVIVMLFLVGLEAAALEALVPAPSPSWARRTARSLFGTAAAHRRWRLCSSASSGGGARHRPHPRHVVDGDRSAKPAEREPAQDRCRPIRFSVLLFQDIGMYPDARAPAVAGGREAVRADPSRQPHRQIFRPGRRRSRCSARLRRSSSAGRLSCGPCFRFVAATGIREIFVAFALLIVVGITLLMQLVVGLSPALGTFLAGVVLAESEYRHELEMDLDPSRACLLAVFFIAVGAGIDFSLLHGHRLAVIGSRPVGFVVSSSLAVRLCHRPRLPHEGPRQPHFFVSHWRKAVSSPSLLIALCRGAGPSRSPPSPASAGAYGGSSDGLGALAHDRR